MKKKKSVLAILYPRMSGERLPEGAAFEAKPGGVVGSAQVSGRGIPGQQQLSQGLPGVRM